MRGSMRGSISTCISLIVVAIVAGAGATIAAAQTGTAPSRTSVGIGEAFTVAVTPPVDGNPRGLRFSVDGVKVGPDVVTPATGDAFVALPGLSTPGKHRVEVSSFNDVAESAKVGLDFWVGPPPPPGLPRIQVTTTQVFDQVPSETGGVTVRLVSAKTDVSEVK